MRRYPRLVGLLWRWHRRAGVLAAVFVVMLAMSGIVLNHSTALQLDRRFVDWPWLAQSYGDPSSNLPAIQLGEQWLFRASDGRVYLDALDVAPCAGELVGAVATDGLLVAACAQELLLITRRGELVESATASTGLPTPLQGIGLLDNHVALQTQGNWRLADLERMEFAARAPAGGAVIRQLVAGQLPAAIRDRIPAPQQWLSWERLLLDLHSGRVFGPLGVLWVDFVGVLVASLAISGTVMWWLHRRRRQ
ncbi:MAG: PepSY domain-containing protein [Halioglobus sp.]